MCIFIINIKHFEQKLVRLSFVVRQKQLLPPDDLKRVKNMRKSPPNECAEVVVQSIQKLRVKGYLLCID